MKSFIDCCIYLIFLGIAGFLIGRFLPKKWFRFNIFPYSPFPFEKNGNIYTTLGVREWKDKFPDMSIILPAIMPSKKLSKTRTTEQLVLMIQETCVAELIHILLCVAGFWCIGMWEQGGFFIALLNVLGNLPYVIIQRYNRPRLIRLLKAQKMTQHWKEAGLCEC